MAKTPSGPEAAAKTTPAPKRRPAPKAAAAAPAPKAAAARKPTAPKPAARKAPGAKPAATAEPAVELRKKHLVERVVKATGAKKKVTREVLDAALAEIGEALSRGEGLNLPPLGKARVNRQKERGAGEVLVLKLRRSGKDEDADESLADTAE